LKIIDTRRYPNISISKNSPRRFKIGKKELMEKFQEDIKLKTSLIS
jgi:hypothetical protein